jgi:hypothetical protein
MFKQLLLIGALLVCFGGNTAVASITPDYRQKHREMLYTVVLIRQSMGSGSGTVIWSEPDGKGEYHSLILTNHHVVRSAIKIEKIWDPLVGKKVDREKRSLLRAEWHVYNNYSHMVGSKSSRAEIVAYDEKLERKTSPYICSTPSPPWAQDWGNRHLRRRVFSASSIKSSRGSRTF